MPRSQKVPTIPTKAVRLEVFDMQGHNGDQPLDYVAFFKFIAEQSSLARREKVGDRVIAVPNFNRSDGRYSFIAYAGSSDTSFLVLDLVNDLEEIRHIEDGKMIATRTVGVIDPIARRAVVQYVHSGVRSGQIATLFEKLAHTRSKEFEGATLEFAPLPGKTFEQQLAAFERVQSASVTLTRPNVDWDDFSTAASAFGAESGAHNVEISASAPRNGTLSKSKGIVQEIKNLVKGKTKSILKSAIVRGFKDDESALTTLNLNKHIESKMVKVPLSNEGLPNPTALVASAMELMDEPAEGQ